MKVNLGGLILVWSAVFSFAVCVNKVTGECILQNPVELETRPTEEIGIVSDEPSMNDIEAVSGNIGIDVDAVRRAAASFGISGLVENVDFLLQYIGAMPADASILGQPSQETNIASERTVNSITTEDWRWYDNINPISWYRWLRGLPVR